MALRENQSIHIHKMVLITLKCFLLLLEYLYRIIILLILMFFFFAETVANNSAGVAEDA
jgi:hypothetical protein